MPDKITPIFYFNKAGTARLSHDGLRWILEMKHGNRVVGHEACFRGLCFIESDKALLLRRIRENGLTVDLNGRRFLAALHSTYSSYRLAIEAYGKAEVASTLGERARAFPPTPKRSVVAKIDRMQTINAKRPGFLRRRKSNSEPSLHLSD